MNPVALIIDDEVQIRRLLRLVLEGENYKVHEAETGQLGLMEIATRKPDVVLLDLGLPDLDGLQVLKRLREWSEVPVIVLTVRDDVQEKVAALDAGADDYITKPFSTPELLARLRAAQRKTRPSEEVSVFKNGDLVVDLTAHVVTRAGREIKLSATEYALLRLFVKHPGRVLTHRHILREIWGPKSEEHRQYLRVYVTHLRQKIEPDPRAQIEYRGTKLEEMDLDAILTWHPELAVVDELAHTNAPGSRHPKRYQDCSSCSTPESMFIQRLTFSTLAVAATRFVKSQARRSSETVPDSVLDLAENRSSRSDAGRTVVTVG